MAKQLLFLEFNEINFESVDYYCGQGLLPNLAGLIARNGWATTHSEKQYEQLEPWIQWVTAHTGKTLAEHGVFRLGDIVQHDLPQIWEGLENRGLRVGAISPMNAKHRLRNAAFFVPDPWTRTDLTARATLRKLYDAIAQAVNDNAQARLTPASLVNLLTGFLAYAPAQHYAQYARLATTARSAPWRKAIFLDRLLADVFMAECRRTKPDFASLFLNAGAHIQHHYLFSAACYQGPHRNPQWYLEPGLDPVREVYEAYDRILGEVRAAFPDARVMIATGLHQEPHGEVTYYWRLRKHAEFLHGMDIPFQRVEPRMSRDFLLVCESEEQARRAEQRLRQAATADGTALFEVDNRGTDLFVMLTYPHDVGPGFTFNIGEQRYGLSRENDVAFVALKNGKHDGTGYFLDTHARLTRGATTFALTQIPERIAEALGVDDLGLGQAKRTHDSAPRSCIRVDAG